MFIIFFATQAELETQDNTNSTTNIDMYKVSFKYVQYCKTD